MAEFSDRPMTPPPKEDQYHGFFPARYVTQYLESYLDNHIYDNRTLRDRIKFNIQVKRVERTPDKLWTIHCENGLVMKAVKLIVATGMTSLPNMPHLPGQETFSGTLLHHKDFGCSTFLSSPKTQHVAILGGAKSAADVAYASAKAGKTVSWIIREEGNGPAALLSAKGRGPYRNSNESFYTRFVANFLPSPFSGRSWFGRFLHGTRVGRGVVRGVWERVDRENKRMVDYHRREGKDMGFGNLEPDTP